jgi:hypothetical protein
MLTFRVIVSYQLNLSAPRSRLSVSSPVMLFLLLTSLPGYLLALPNPRVASNEISRRPSPFYSATYKMLFPQLLCFENDPSFMGGVPPLREKHELHNHARRLDP